MNNNNRTRGLSKSLNSQDIFIAGVAVVVAASTLIGDLTGYFTFGIGFAIATALAFIVNLFLGMSAADLGVAYPRSGGLYDFFCQRNFWRSVWEIPRCISRSNFLWHD